MLTQKQKLFLLNNHHLSTPYVVLDLDIVKKRYDYFKSQLTNVEVFYAVKCNPAPEVLSLLNQQASCFDVASLEEAELCLNLGIESDKISWGSTIKKSQDIKVAYDKGIRLFAFDSLSELEKIAYYAPKSKVYCRIIVDNMNALMPLSKKFGCSNDLCIDLLVKAKELGLTPLGISFHVGSQQMDPLVWKMAIENVANLFNIILHKYNIKLQMLNIGGGFPALGYLTEQIDFAYYAKIINHAITDNFDTNVFDDLTIIAEPGRFMVADAGVLKTEVVLVAHKSNENSIRWVYLDAGVFNGLMETYEEGIRYKICTHDELFCDNFNCTAKKYSGAFIAGPTCDSVDVMYEKHLYSLPDDLHYGDFLYILSTGGYTITYSTVAFNGFLPLRAYYI